MVEVSWKFLLILAWMNPSAYAANPMTTAPSLGPAPSQALSRIPHDLHLIKMPHRKFAEFSNLLNHNVKMSSTSSPPAKKPSQTSPSLMYIKRKYIETNLKLSPYSSIDITYLGEIQSERGEESRGEKG
jgi:hypothetical protein